MVYSLLSVLAQTCHFGYRFHSVAHNAAPVSRSARIFVLAVFKINSGHTAANAAYGCYCEQDEGNWQSQSALKFPVFALFSRGSRFDLGLVVLSAGPSTWKVACL